MIKKQFYHLLFGLVLSGLGAPLCLIDEKQDVEEPQDVGEHHEEDREVEEYQGFVP